MRSGSPRRRHGPRRGAHLAGGLDGPRGVVRVPVLLGGSGGVGLAESGSGGSGLGLGVGAGGVWLGLGVLGGGWVWEGPGRGNEATLLEGLGRDNNDQTPAKGEGKLSLAIRLQ